MAIAFIPVRDQISVTNNAKKTAKTKGEILRRLSSGNKTSDSSNGISEYTQILRFNRDITNYRDTINDINLSIYKIESALMVTDFIAYKYQELANIIEAIPTDLSTNWTPTIDEQHDKNIRIQFQEEINVIAESIKNFIDLQINSKKVLGDDGKTVKLDINGTTETVTLSDMSIDPTSGNNVLGITYDDLKKLVYEKTGSNAELGKYSDFKGTATSAIKKDTILAAAKRAAEVAAANYNVLLSKIKNLEAREELTNVAKANTEAALSVLKDIDIQEEIVNLLETQVLEELSAEALKAIKDSARFVIRLVQS